MDDGWTVTLRRAGSSGRAFQHVTDKWFESANYFRLKIDLAPTEEKRHPKY
jgi:hypothetical protein